jgi:hypothetical protein
MIVGYDAGKRQNEESIAASDITAMRFSSGRSSIAHWDALWPVSAIVPFVSSGAP